MKTAAPSLTSVLYWRKAVRLTITHPMSLDRRSSFRALPQRRPSATPVTRGLTRLGLLLLAVVGSAAGSGSVEAQTLSDGQTIADGLRDLAASLNLGRGLETLSLISQTPGAEEATFSSEDQRIKSSRLHASHVFSRWDDQGNLLTSPYVEFTLGKTNSTQREEFGTGSDFLRTDLRYRSRSMVLGVGAAIPATHNVRIVALALAGRSRLRIDSTFTGPDAARFYDLYEGLLNNAELKSTFIGGAVRIDYRTLLFKDTWLTLAPRYNYYHSIDDTVTDRGLQPRGSAGVATFRAGIERATKVYVGEREFFAGVFGRATELFGDKSNQFGFQRLGEIGGTLRLDYPVDPGVGIGAYASLIRGSGVTGHTLGITLTFSQLGWRSAR
ncbi:hypothetical protein KZ820_17970 [Sphingomonas sp. RRHST34]|uniref:Autotransporter domain-containing protein n=1 Tax=Sphingomonas citri TaxID=2862499 RepID=A0ABS7BSP5_9SPHN|nr:hypothetical protein [Sphingomonas citri]MBW6532633.1 hypothetical protein [Sphingomonas citri]